MCKKMDIGRGAYVNSTLLTSVKKKNAVLFFSGQTHPDSEWHDRPYISLTNCYAYAFNILNVLAVNPRNNKQFCDHEDGFQLGSLRDGAVDAKERRRLFMGEPPDLKVKNRNYQELINEVTKDVDAVGITFKRINPIEINTEPENGYRVALVLRGDGTDWHWYRQEGKNTWSHKQGQGKTMIARDAGKRSIGKGGSDRKNEPMPLRDDNIKEAAKLIGYDVFVDYFSVIHNDVEKKP